MRILDENKVAGGNVADFSVAGLILDRAIEPYSQHALRHRVPTNLPPSGMRVKRIRDAG